MLNKDRVVVLMHEAQLVGFEWLADYFVAVAGKYKGVAKRELKYAITNAALQIKKIQKPSDGQIKEIIIDCFYEDTGLFETPEEVSEIKFPTRPAGVESENASKELRRKLLSTQHATAIAREKQLRIKAGNRGQILADAACKLEGYFQWAASGFETGPERTYALRETWTETLSEKGNLEWHGSGTFAYWINRGGPEPGRTTVMNCWEAIFFSAYKAGLISVQRLRLVHAKATQAARGSEQNMDIAGKFYFQAILESFNHPQCLPMVQEIGLLPKPGDIVFYMGDHHISLCVDFKPASDFRQSVIVMSHNKIPGQGFQRMSIAAMAGSSSGGETFVPCPF